MNKFKYLILLLGIYISLSTSCNDDKYDFEYKAEGKTEVGAKLVAGTDIIGQVFHDSTYTVTNGLKATEMQYLSSSGYAMRMFIFEIDLTNPSVSIEASTPNNKPAFGMQQMTVQATHEDSEGHKVWGGVNADFYNTSTGEPQGIVYKDGVAIKTTFKDDVCTYFAITNDGKAVIAGQDVYNDLKSTFKEVVGGRVWLVQDGALPKQTSAVVEPRTCIGVSKDGLRVYIMAVDGRNFWYSNGINYEDMGKCMKALGAHNSINLDGGGSTTFFIRNTPDFADDRFEIRNWPSDNGGRERAVANGLLIISK